MTVNVKTTTTKQQTDEQTDRRTDAERDRKMRLVLTEDGDKG